MVARICVDDCFVKIDYQSLNAYLQLESFNLSAIQKKKKVMIVWKQEVVDLAEVWGKFIQFIFEDKMYVITYFKINT